MLQEPYVRGNTVTGKPLAYKSLRLEPPQTGIFLVTLCHRNITTDLGMMPDAEIWV